MKDYNKFIWELSEEAEQDPYTVYEKILAEFREAENELKEQLDSDKTLSQELLQYRNKLNKLLARSSPFLINDYNFLKTYREERGLCA